MSADEITRFITDFITAYPDIKRLIGGIFNNEVRKDIDKLIKLGIKNKVKYVKLLSDELEKKFPQEVAYDLLLLMVGSKKKWEV